MTNLTWLSLLGDPSYLPKITSRIVCTWPAGVIFKGITELHINSLAFISCGHNDSAAVNITSVDQSNIVHCSIVTWYTYLTVIDNTFQNNSAGDGGVFSVQHSILTITDNIFQKNYAKDGGVLSVEHGDLTITNNTFQNNSATRAGGVLHVAESIHAVTDNIFQNNYGSEGGVLYVMVSNLMLTENTFQNNSADIGGVLYIVCSTLNLIANVFQRNVGSELGGAIFAYSPCHYYDINTTYVRMHGSNIIENNRAEYGGGIAALGSQLELEGNSIKACTASYGGGVYVHNTDSLLLKLSLL